MKILLILDFFLDLTTNLIASPSKDAFYIISTRTRNITCQIDNLENPNEIVWA